MADDSNALAELEARLRGGDEQALAVLFSRYRERLKQLVEFRLDQRMRGRVDASDVLQEAFLDANQRLRHFTAKQEMSVFVWLRQVTLQRLIDVHRRHVNAQARNVKQEVAIRHGDPSAPTSALMAAQLVGHFTSPSQQAMRAEMLEQVQQALDCIDETDREVLALRHFEELTNNEVAEVLGITKAGASNRYVRALARLKAALEKIPGFFEE